MTNPLTEIFEDLIKGGEGSRGGTIVGHTASGKPIYGNARNPAHKTFSKEDHLDAIHAHHGARERLADEHRKQRNNDGTVSDKHIKKRKQLEKQIQFHADQAARHREKYEPSAKVPDQRDFDRMDRKNDPQKRSSAWGRKSLESNMGIHKSGDNMDQLKKLGISIQGEPLIVKSDFSVRVGAVDMYSGQSSRQGATANAADALNEQLSKGFCHGLPLAKSKAHAKGDDNKDNYGVKYTKNTHGEEHHSDNDKEVEDMVTDGGEVDRVHADEEKEYPRVKENMNASGKVKESELERSLDDVIDILKASGEIKMPKKEFVAEHKKLVGVLNSPSKKDDKKEAKDQKKEMDDVVKRSLDSLIFMADDPFTEEQIANLHENSEELEVEKSAFSSGKKTPSSKMFHLKKEPKDAEERRMERQQKKDAGLLKKADDKPWPGEGIKGAGMPAKKQGEGSHGGKVVGHTAGGKPVYAKQNKPKGTGSPQPQAKPAAAPVRSSGDVMGQADKMQQRSRAEAALAVFKRSRENMDNLAKGAYGNAQPGMKLNDPAVMPKGPGVVNSAERGVRNAAASVGSMFSGVGKKLAPTITSGLNAIRGNTTAIAAPATKSVKKSELDDLVDMVKSKACEAPTLKKKVVEQPVKKANHGQFIVAKGVNGVVMDFGNLTGNPFADNANRILSESFDPVQNQIAQYQQNTYRKSLTDFIEGKQPVDTGAPRNDRTDPYGQLDKSFDQQVAEEFGSEKKGFAPVNTPDVTASVGGEVVKAQSETDAAVLEMFKAEMAAMSEGGIVVDTAQKITA